MTGAHSRQGQSRSRLRVAAVALSVVAALALLGGSIFAWVVTQRTQAENTAAEPETESVPELDNSGSDPEVASLDLPMFETGSFRFLWSPDGMGTAGTEGAPPLALAVSDGGATLAPETAQDANTQRIGAVFDEVMGAYVLVSAVDARVFAQSGDELTLAPFSGESTQFWRIDDHLDGTISLINAESGQVLAVSDGLPVLVEAADARDLCWTYASCDPLAAGEYALTAGDSRLVWDVAWASASPHGRIRLWSANDSMSQRFRITPVGGGAYAIESLTAALAVAPETDTTGALAVGVAVTQQTMPAAGSPAEKPDPRMLWRPEICTTGIVFHAVAATADADLAIGLSDTGGEDGMVQPQTDAGLVLASAAEGAVQAFVPTYLGESEEVPCLTGIATRICTEALGDDASAWTAIYPVTMRGASYLVLPSATDLSAVPLVFGVTGGGLTAQIAAAEEGPFADIRSGDTIDLASGAFAQDSFGAYQVFLRPVSSRGVGGEMMEVRLIPSGGTMALYLWSDDPANRGRAYIEASPDHSAQATGRAVLIDADGTAIYDGALTQIKGRGNSTWTDDAKKPYQIKLAKKADLVGCGQPSKTWVLLAEAEDISNLRNYLALYLGRAIGLEETSSCAFADLYYDGEYRGIYLVCEKVQIAEGRVDIRDLEDETEELNPDIEAHGCATAVNKYGQEFKYTVDVANPADVSGGYLLEFDKRYRDEYSWMATGAGPCVVKSPERASYEQMKYISELMYEAIAETRKAAGDMGAYFDVTSVARSWMVYAFGRVLDYWYWSSTYFYVDAGEDALIHGGPLWDFDNSFGNDSRGYEVGFGHARDTFFYYNRQFRTESQRVYREEFRPVMVQLLYGRDAEGAAGTVDGLVLDEVVATYAQASAIDAMLWGMSGFGYSVKTMDEEYAYLRTWMERQLAYMDAVVLDDGTWL